MRFLRKHGHKIIALTLVVAILISLSNLGIFAALLNRVGISAEKETTAPTEASAPEETLTLEETLSYLTDAIAQNPEDPALYIQRASIYYNLGQPEAAIEDYTRALELEETARTHYLRAVVYSATGDHQNAYTDLSAALEAEPDNRDYLSLMADTCNTLKKYEQSLECLDILLATEPENCVLLTLAGDACVYLGNFEKSLTYYEKAITHYNETATESGISQANLYSAYGNSLKTLNMFPEAAAAYDQALALSDSTELYFQRGFCLLQSENYALATEDFTHCIEQEYEVDFAHFQRGLCYYAQNQYSEAVADFIIYETAFPEKTDTWLYMGLCYQNLGQYSSAISYYTKCIEADISVGNCYYNIGNCYYNTSSYSSAISYYTKAINSGNYIYESLLNRGISYIQLNKYNEAKADLKRVIDECSDPALVASAQKSYDPIKNITIITKN